MKTDYKAFIVVMLPVALSSCRGQFELTKSDCRDGKVRQGSSCVEAATESSKLNIAGCIDPDLSHVLTTDKLTLCNGTQATGTLTACTGDGQSNCVVAGAIKSADTSKFTASKIVPGTTVAGVAGAAPTPAPSCTSDAQQNCTNTGNFRAVDSSTLAAATLPIGVTVAGIAGTKRPTQSCRNGAALATFDAAGATNIGATGLAITGYSAANPTTFTVGSAHGFATNAPVYLTNTANINGGASGLLNNTQYLAIFVSATQFQVAQVGSPGVAFGNGGVGGAGPASFFNWNDGVTSSWDTIDDFNAAAGNASPSSSAFGSTNYICNESNFKKIADTTISLTATGFVPTGATVALGTPALTWTQIWQDQLTGLYFTNPLKNSTAGSSWADVYRMCSGLNSGDGAGNWRLLTQKELMQLYIDGIAKIGFPTALVDGDHYWSASAVSSTTNTAYVVDLASGSTYPILFTGRNGTGNWALCVR